MYNLVFTKLIGHLDDEGFSGEKKNVARCFSMNLQAGDKKNQLGGSLSTKQGIKFSDNHICKKINKMQGGLGSKTALMRIMIVVKVFGYF